MTEKKRALTTDCLAFRAAKALRTRGPQTKESILLLADFGHTAVLQAKRRDVAMKTGWLVELNGQIFLSEYALHYFDGIEPEPAAPKAPTGSLATPREIKPFRPMSPQYRVNSRGTRADAPDCSVRAFPSHFARVAS